MPESRDSDLSLFCLQAGVLLALFSALMVSEVPAPIWDVGYVAKIPGICTKW